MTVSMRRGGLPSSSGRALRSPPVIASEISVVIPARDNLRGLARALSSLREHCPALREVIVVDSASQDPIRATKSEQQSWPVHVLREEAPGVARARNAGWRAATGTWILFMDSDCLATGKLLDGFVSASNGAVAYAGFVRATNKDALSAYYDAQKTLVPPPTDHDRPSYLVTANALVWRDALDLVDGFDERFVRAGGEDIDLAYRLIEFGDLSYAPDAHMLHDFEPSLAAFLRRFVRYGRGNKILARKHRRSHRPRPFIPAVHNTVQFAAAGLQYAAMLAGYTFG
jgi:glycosyltransferase involved in cell wall biosynthesis